jgi:hypothetical protein
LSCLGDLPDGLIELECSFNKLRILSKLPKKLERLSCNNNNLHILPNLKKLKNLRIVKCDNNNLYFLPSFNEKIVLFSFKNNLISEIFGFEYTDLFHNNKNILNKKVNILNNFRYLFYSLKFKNKFRYWLWEKVKKPKIENNFHPLHLEDYFDEDKDLHTFLENW